MTEEALDASTPHGASSVDARGGAASVDVHDGAASVGVRGDTVTTTTVPRPTSEQATAAAAGDASGIPVRRTHLVRDLTAIVVTTAVLLAALGVGAFFVYRALYSPSAFVQQYLSLLSTGHAADALRIPGVALDGASLKKAGLPEHSSGALLRQAALSSLTDVHIESEKRSGDVVEVTASYTAGKYQGTTTFSVERDGSIGFVPTWRFARSPLAVVDLTVHGSMSFQINGFTLDKRQVSGADADPADAVPMLVFSPGLYAVRVDTTISQSRGVDVLSDAPMKDVPVEVQTEPTDKFVSVVQDRVDDFLKQCATQQVLQPTGCPFGYVVHNRLDGLPEWSIEKTPKITVVPDGEGWAIPETKGDAHIVVDIQAIYDGSITHIDEDVPFTLIGTIDIGPDGAASIRVSEPGD